MLRKLIFFAITSGLAKKAYDAYRQRQSVAQVPVRHVPRAPTHRRATTVRAAAPADVEN